MVLLSNVTFIHLFIPLHCGRTGVHWAAAFWSWDLLQSCRGARSLQLIPGTPLHWKMLYGTSVPTETFLRFITQFPFALSQWSYQVIHVPVIKQWKQHLQRTPQGSRCWYQWCQALQVDWSLFSETGTLSHSLSGLQEQTALACGAHILLFQAALEKTSTVLTSCSILLMLTNCKGDPFPLPFYTFNQDQAVFIAKSG